MRLVQNESADREFGRVTSRGRKICGHSDGILEGALDAVSPDIALAALEKRELAPAVHRTNQQQYRADEVAQGSFCARSPSSFSAPDRAAFDSRTLHFRSHAILVASRSRRRSEARRRGVASRAALLNQSWRTDFTGAALVGPSCCCVAARSRSPSLANGAGESAPG